MDYIESRDLIKAINNLTKAVVEEGYANRVVSLIVAGIDPSEAARLAKKPS